MINFNVKIVSMAPNDLRCVPQALAKAHPDEFYNLAEQSFAGLSADESTPFWPLSPYAVAKACVANLVASYCEAYQLYAYTRFLLNRESPLSPNRFVTRKIFEAAFRTYAGLDSHVTLGNLDFSRNWGWVSDCVKAMWMLLQQDAPLDDVVRKMCKAETERWC